MQKIAQSPLKEMSWKDDTYTKNTDPYKNWIDLERQARTHCKIHEKTRHLEAMNTKARELMEKSQFKFAMQCIRLRIMEIFYFGQQSDKYKIPFAVPLHYNSPLELSLYNKMSSLLKEFELHNAYPTTHLFLFHNKTLCKDFEALDKEYGMLRYTTWIDSR